MSRIVYQPFNRGENLGVKVGSFLEYIKCTYDHHKIQTPVCDKTANMKTRWGVTVEKNQQISFKIKILVSVTLKEENLLLGPFKYLVHIQRTLSTGGLSNNLSETVYFLCKITLRLLRGATFLNNLLSYYRRYLGKH